MLEEDTPIVIIQCCCNCKYHVWCTRHNEWKYTEHFNEIKRKVEKTIRMAIVVKNPTPDGLVRLDDPSGEQNKYYNEDTQEVVVFPRLGAFEVYLFDVLIFSKLQSNQWPQHSRLMEKIQAMVDDKLKGLDLQKYSVQGAEDDMMVESLAPKLQLNQQSYRSMEVSKLEPAPSIEVEEVRLPPASKLYRKIFKSFDKEKEEKPLDKSASPTKVKKRAIIPKVNPQPRRASIEIGRKGNNEAKSKDVNGSLPIIIVNDGEPRQALRTDKSNFTDAAGSLGFRTEDQQLRQGSQQQPKDSLKFGSRDHEASPLALEIHDRNIHSEAMVRPEEPPELEEIESQKMLEEFTKDFNPVRVKDLGMGPLTWKEKRYVPVRERMRLTQVVNETICLPNRRTIVHIDDQIINKEIIDQRAARLPRLRIKKEYEEVLNKDIIDERGRHIKIIAPQLSMDVNREIIQEVASRPPIIYESTQVQMTLPDYEDNEQQAEIILEIPGEYAREYFQAGVQAVETLADIEQEDYGRLMKRSVSVQMSNIAEVDDAVFVEDTGVQMEIQRDERAMNTDTPFRNFATVGINTDDVDVIEKMLKPEPQEVQGEVPVLDETFAALNEPRKSIVDTHGYHSVERYQDKDSKYHWTGRAFKEPEEQTIRRFNKEKLLLALYQLIGIQVVKKQLSRQLQANTPQLPGQVVPFKPNLLLHVMTEEVPDINFMSAFNEYNFHEGILVVSDSVKLRKSKSTVKLEGYGKLLAAAKFLNDLEVFSAQHLHIGFLLVEGRAINFTKLSGENYDQEARLHDCPVRMIEVTPDGSRRIRFDQLSDQLKLEFISQLKQITNISLPQAILKCISQSNLFAEKGSFELAFGKSPEKFAELFSQRRDTLCSQEYAVELRMFTKFGSLRPTIPQYWLNSIYLTPQVLYQDKKLPLDQCIRKWFEAEQHKILVVKSPSSIGKTSTLQYLKKQLESVYRTDCVLMDMKTRPTLEQLRGQAKQLKNCMTLLVNNYQRSQHIQELLKLFNINSYPNKRLVLTSDTSNYVDETVSGVFIAAGLEELVTECELTPFDDKQIGEYIKKHIEVHGVPKGVQREAVEKQVMKLDESRRVISSPSLLNFVMHFLAELTERQQQLSKFELLKYVVARCDRNQKELCAIMGMRSMNAEEYLNAVALNLFKNGLQEVPESQHPDYQNFTEGKYVGNLLEMFPLVRANGKLSFYHSNFTLYFFSLAMSQIVEKGYKGIELSHITRSRQVIHLLKEKYSIRGGQNRLLDIIEQSKSNPNLAEQASNAVTLLSKIGFVFSDLNFQGAQLQNSDLSFSIMYNTNLRGANLDGTSLFNCHMTECVLDSCSINGVDLGLRKYLQDKDIYSGALSLDGKLVAVSYGNNLLLLHSDNGKQFKMLSGHTDLVREVFFSRDGQSVVSISDDRSIRIWNLKSFSPIVLKVPSKVGIKFSPQAERICCITKDTVRIWSIRLMGGEVTLKGHSDEVKHVDFSNNGQRVVTASKDKTVMLWTIEGEFLQVFKGHEGEVHYAAISPNGKIIASASADSTIRMWSIEKAQQTQQFNFSSKISMFRFSPQEKYLMVAGADDYNIKALNLKTGQEAFAFSGHEDEIISLDFDKVGEKIISVSADRTVRVWNFKRFRQTQFLQGHPEQVWSVAASRFNDFFVSGSADNTVKLWDTKTGDQLRTFEGHTGQVFCVAFSPLGKKVASGSEDKRVIIWDILTGEKLQQSTYHKQWVQCVVFSNDGYFLASSDASGLLVIWDVYADKIKTKIQAHESQLFSLCFNSNNDRIATCAADSKVKIFSTGNGKEERVFEGHEGNVWCVKFLDEQKLVSGAKDGTLILWNITNGQVINKLKNESSVQSIAVVNNDRMAFSLENGTIRLVDIASNRQIKSFRNSEPIWSIDVCRDKTRLVSAGGDNTVRMWSLNESKQKFNLKFGTLVFNRNASHSANLVNHKQITITDLVQHRQIQHHFPDDLIQVVSFTATDNLILLKDDNTYSEYDVARRQQRPVNNTNQYNINNVDLLMCKGKFARTFDRCSFKKMRGATEESVQLFQE